MLPFLRYRQIPDVVQERLYTLAQLFLEYADPEISPNTVHMQLYTFSDLYQRAFNRTFRLAGPLKQGHRIIFPWATSGRPGLLTLESIFDHSR